MKCVLCKKNKLRRDFPGSLLSTTCDHPPNCCLRCVADQVLQSSMCPYPSCGAEVDPNGKEMNWCSLRLQQLYPDIHNTWESQTEGKATHHAHDTGARMSIFVTVLNGDTKALYVTPNTTVYELKENIEGRMKYEISKQKLVYQGTDMEVMDSSLKLMTLGNYGVEPNSTIHLLVLLYDIPDRLNHVVFDLSWGYPVSGRDYLDASCWVFNINGHDAGDWKSGGGVWKRNRENYTVSKPGPRGASYVTYHYIEDWEFHAGRVDYFNKTRFSLQHSGDEMDDGKRVGHQTIEVHLKELPKFVSHLIFTLSSFRAPSIAHFPNPCLSFYDAGDKSQTALCKTDLQKAQKQNSQAIVMCSVARTKAGWRIFESGALSAGNAQYHNPLISTMRKLIKSGQAG